MKKAKALPASSKRSSVKIKENAQATKFPKVNKPGERVSIPVGLLEFMEDGNTIWIHSSVTGGTVVRIKCTGKIKSSVCKTSPNSHVDLIINGDIDFCTSLDCI